MSRERHLGGMRRLLQLPASPQRIDKDIEDEIRFHIESRIAELIGMGALEHEARARAEQEYGNVRESRHELMRVDRRRARRGRRSESADAFVQDCAYALRSLRHRPAFVATVVLTLALGIGATAVMFGIIDRLLLRAPPHVENASRILRLYELPPGRPMAQAEALTTYPLIEALRTDVGSLEQVGGYSLAGAYSVGRGNEATSARVILATGNYFAILGPRPHRGRFFTAADDRDGEESRVAVLSFGYWQRYFGGNDAVIGREIVLDNSRFTIIGVAPRDFSGAEFQPVDLWVPASALASPNFGSDWRTSPNAVWIRPIALLRDGSTPQRVALEGTLATQRAIRSWQGWRDTLTTLTTSSVIAARGPAGASIEARISVALFGVAAIVLVIACANAANLLLARAVSRRHEFAVRLALGARRGRLLRDGLIQAGLLSLAAAAVALTVSHWGGALVRNLLIPDVAWDSSPVDARVVGIALLATVVTCVIAGIVPALRASRTDPAGALRADPRATRGQGTRVRAAFVIVQAALSVVLVAGAGLFVRSH